MTRGISARGTPGDAQLSLKVHCPLQSAVDKVQRFGGGRTDILNIILTKFISFSRIINNLVYYGLALSTGDLGMNEYWAFFLSGAMDIPALVYATFGVERFGRKWNTVIFELIAGVACIASVFTRKCRQRLPGVIVSFNGLDDKVWLTLIGHHMPGVLLNLQG